VLRVLVLFFNQETFMKLLSLERALKMGYSGDPRKRRRQHRVSARHLLRQGGFFNAFSARGSTFGDIAHWHLAQARLLAH
jgi:hypothetical protein